MKEFETLSELLEDLDREGITGQQRTEAVNSFLSNLAWVKGRPFVASFELTPLCNFDCKMCYVHLEPSQMQNRSLLTVDEWKHIIDMAVASGIMFADLTGGECLTYPGFKEVYLHLWKRGIQPSVLTNGSLLTNEMVLFFCQYPPKLIQITVYGSNEEAYERITGRGAFGAVMLGIKRLQEAKLRFKVIITPNRYMQEDSESLLSLLRKMQVNYEIGGITLSARPETGRKVEDYRIGTESFVALQKADDDYRRGLRGKQRIPTEYRYSAKSEVIKPGAPCSAGRNTFHINWKGEMTPCISFYDIASSVLKNGVDGAWKEIQQKMATFQEPAECVECEYKRYCNSCPAEKCYGKLCNELNNSVCERLKAYINAGMIGSQSDLNEVRKEDVHEASIC